MPKVSMIMSAFRRNHGDKNCPNMLRRSLDSILGQSFRDFELVLIDDGSTDGTEQVCREYEKLDSRIRLYRFEKNSGLPAKRYNDGMRLAQADYFMYMFDDDTLFPPPSRTCIRPLRRRTRTAAWSTARQTPSIRCLAR